MRLPTLAVLFVLVGAASAADDYLVRVDFSPCQAPLSVAEAGADVLFGLDGGCIARASAAALGRLNAAPFSCRVLDTDPEGKRYVYVMPDEGFDRARLAGYGDVLTEDRDGVLLRTTEDGIKGLNRLPVELAGISLHPMVFANLQHPTPDPAPLPDSLIWLLVGRVTQDSAEATLRRLIAFRTRYSYVDSCWSAARWFQSRLAAYGCDSTYLDTFAAGFAPSIVGVKRGRVNPNRIFVVCGHVDNTSEIPYDYAPGSDDNASGAGIVLNTCRVFADMDVDNTVWFVGFTGEEQGLVGSDTFARHCRERGDTIVLAINHDMNSYGTAGRDSIRIVGKRTNPPCSTWVDFFLAQADTFTDLKCRREIVDQQQSSDHHSFWQYGYTAIRDRYLDRDPEYHTTGDTIGPFQYVNCGTNNLPMYTEAIKATVAVLAKLAGPHPCVGVAEPGPRLAARSFALSASPNPSSGVVAIHLDSSPPPARSSLSVYDASGRLVLWSAIRNLQSEMALDLTGLGHGVYFVCLRAGAVTASSLVVLAD
jgi:hypothetical protein